MSAVELVLMCLEEQQAKAKERSAPWAVAEQLKDICRADPAAAEMIYQDLANEEMSITAAEKKIKAYADKHRTGNFAVVTPQEAEQILREFYCIPERKPEQEPPTESGIVLNLSDFLR